jgi:hypothetical protein
VPDGAALRVDRQPARPQGLHLPVPELGVESTHVPVSGSVAEQLQEVNVALQLKLQLKSDLRLDSFSDMTRSTYQICICILNKTRWPEKN